MADPGGTRSDPPGGATAKLAELTVTVPSHRPTRPSTARVFAYHLPQALADNRPHRIGVTPAGEPGGICRMSCRNLALPGEGVDVGRFRRRRHHCGWADSTQVVHRDGRIVMASVSVAF
jgi:hypothetical protein